jgi:hypothetical protein
MEGINASGEGMKKDINGKLKEIKDKTEDFMDTIVMNVTLEIDENMEQFTHLDTAVNEVKKHVKNIERISVAEKVDGKWSNWGKWSSCSVSCGSGNRYRERSCSNPLPSDLGKQCEGNNRQTDSCTQERCRDHIVAFHAYGISAGSTGSSVPTFPNTIINHGNDYDRSSGIFTCEVPGIYHFAVTLSIKDQDGSSTTSCYLTINSGRKVQIYIHVYLGDGKYAEYPATATGVFHLSKGDTVKISDCEKYNRFYSDTSTIFMGFLVTADK